MITYTTVFKGFTILRHSNQIQPWTVCWDQGNWCEYWSLMDAKRAILEYLKEA
jgi:hypothetical protein